MNSVRKGDIFFDSNDMTFWKRHNYGDIKKSVVTGHSGGGGEGWLDGHSVVVCLFLCFYGSKTIMYDPVMDT